MGMASSLLKKSISVLVSLGYESLVLNVHPRNIGAVNLYRKIGFTEL
ncbi:MAG: GNAT family N-acetyltransferase [Velocimicrobium sp.]